MWLPDAEPDEPECDLARLFQLPDNGHVGAIPITRMPPAILVIVGHALLGERLHLLEGAGGVRLLQRENAYELVAACIVHLVQLVSRAEFRSNRVPKQLHR